MGETSKRMMVFTGTSDPEIADGIADAPTGCATFA